MIKIKIRVRVGVTFNVSVYSKIKHRIQGYIEPQILE